MSTEPGTERIARRHHPAIGKFYAVLHLFDLSLGFWPRFMFLRTFMLENRKGLDTAALFRCSCMVSAVFLALFFHLFFSFSFCVAHSFSLSLSSPPSPRLSCLSLSHSVPLPPPSLLPLSLSFSFSFPFDSFISVKHFRLSVYFSVSASQPKDCFNSPYARIKCCFSSCFKSV